MHCARALSTLLASLLLATAPSPAQTRPAVTVREIRIEGNDALSVSDLRDAMVSKPSQPYQQGQLVLDRQRILERYRQEGYLFAEADLRPQPVPGDTTEVVILVNITEGARAVVGRILLQGNAAIQSSAILDGFETRVGDVLDPRALERDIRSLIRRYAQLGYPYTAISIDDIGIMEGDSARRLQIRLAVDEGERVTIREVKVRGNKETSEHVIVREARLALPELFSEDKIANIARRLNKLNIFTSVHEPELYVGKGGGGLLISVEEGNTNTFDGVIGYVPGRQDGEPGFVTGMVNVTMRNLFGSARKLDLRWQRDDRYSQEIQTRYVEPWVLDVPVNLGVSFFQRQQDTIYVRRLVGLNAEMMLTDVFSMSGTVQQENIIPSTTVAVQTVSSTRTLTAGISLHYDTRDDAVTPTSGVNCRTDYLIGDKKVYSTPFPGIQANGTVHRISVDAESYVEPIPRQVIALGVHGRQVSSDHLEVSDRYRFGGTNTLRGYRENQFTGSRIAWSNTEYRFLLARRTYCYGFFDAGYYFLPADDQLGIASSNGLKYGYGIGLRVETSLGNIGVSIALGEGDSFSQAKLHFGLLNDF